MSIQRMMDSPVKPYRTKRPTTDKIIFISCEGSRTEWDYFEKIIGFVYGNVSSKVRVINVDEDILNKKDYKRDREEKNQYQVLILKMFFKK